MTDFTALNAEAQRLIDAALAADALTDAGTLAAKDAQIAKLKADLAACQAGLPGPVPPDPIPVPPGFVWPNATNTGAKGTLSAYTGSSTINAGAVIQSKLITFGLIAKGAGIQFKNCRIDYGDMWGVQASEASGILFEDCTFVAHGGNAPILSGTAATIRRCNISGAENGIVLQNGAHLVEGNYIWGLVNPPTAHPDGISVQGWQNGTIIRDNHVEACGTSAVFLKCDFGPIVNTTIQHNRLKNMGATDLAMYRYAIYSVHGNATTNPPTGTIIRDNVIQKGVFGHWATEGSVAISGNTDFDTGKPI